MNKFSYTFFAFVILILSSCLQEVPSSLIGTQWENKVSGDLA